MIKKLFLPSVIGKHRIFAEQILGCSLEENRMSVALINAQRSSTTINFLAEEQLEAGFDDTYQERAAAALKKIIAKAPSFNLVNIAIPASIIVFKELKLPFIDIDKIKMIIEYEVEPLLPFSLEECIVDFIVTKQEDGNSQVLVAAVRIDDLTTHLEPFNKAGLTPHKITIDLFALYGLYQQIPEYQKLPHASAIVDIGSRVTRVAFLYHGELRLTRNIQNGFLSLTKTIAHELSKPEEEIALSLMERGLQKTGSAPYDTAVEKACMTLLNDIQFTLNSFSLKLSFYEGINKILFVGSYASMPEFIPYGAVLLQTTCELFSCEKIFENSTIKNGIKTGSVNWGHQAIALGTALTYQPHREFNLRRKIFAIGDNELAYNQLLASCILIIAITLGLFTHGYLQISGLEKTTTELEQKEVKKLKAILPEDIKLPKTLTFKRLISEVETIIENRKEAWGSFNKNNLTNVEILQEFTLLLDRKKFNVRIENLSIGLDEQKTQRITLEGVLYSKTGSEPWAHFGLFEKIWDESKNLALIERIDPTATEDGKGVRFTAKFKRKES